MTRGATIGVLAAAVLAAWAQLTDRARPLRPPASAGTRQRTEAMPAPVVPATAPEGAGGESPGTSRGELEPPLVLLDGLDGLSLPDTAFEARGSSSRRERDWR